MNWTEGLINAIDYIETHLIDGEVLDQNTIARQAYSSPDNFRKVFHLITGYTIGEYTKGYKHGFDDGIKECVEILKKKNP